MSIDVPSTSDLMRKTGDIYGGDEALIALFFNSEIKALGNKKPKELLGSLEGRKLVNDVLEKIKWGVFS
ncbi:hypothetical protein BCU94_09375 [Shewanella sp. 10N.286.52.C2]|uniref:MbcA/ParS/Xre antitoxin family protein n=1 Tax=Shewanella sp. 10N.286.52.C2 TaxID=1880838 RepID=UPI000C854C2B|nr:MbcA/ParS/Xre antitoxin family protein [Shewanella sp. 10N.286.52.C2]PMG31150.1 hypothetical protein BCU94_09375 [Shewanella sp. 10N.286.52.C2]